MSVVKVKRDGPRGWHWIDASRFDPAVHVLHEEPDQPAAPQAEPRRRGRPPKDSK